MNSETYQCARCGGVFTKGRSDEEAQKEAMGLFGEIPHAEQEIVCDDCWKKLMSQFS